MLSSLYGVLSATGGLSQTGVGCCAVAHPAMVSPDSSLIERAQRGDRAAFQALFLAHRAQTSRLLARLVPHSDVEDVTQEVFLQVFRSLPSFRGDARFSTWLYRLTLNVARMHLRRQQARPKLSALSHDEAEASEPSHEGAPHAAAERHERLEALTRLLARLSDKKRETLVLHDFQGLPAEEISAIMAVPIMTVRTRLFYARRELYAALGEEPALSVLLDVLPGGGKLTHLASTDRAARDEERE